MVMIHPSSQELQRFAERTPPGAIMPRVAAHLETCGRCREFVMASRKIADDVRALPMLTASQTTLDRILESRQSGRRFILPPDDAAHGNSQRFHLAARIAAVIVAAVTVGLFVQQRSRPSDNPANADTSTMTSLFMFSGVPSVYAETVPDTRVFAPGLPGRTLAPMSLSFRRELVNPANQNDRRVEGYATLSVLSRMRGADSLWLISSNWTGLKGTPEVDNARSASESLYVQRKSLAPVARMVHVTPYRRFPGINIAQRFVGDSVLGEMSLTNMTTRRPIAASVPFSRGGVVPSDAAGPVLLMGVRLSPTWSTKLNLLGWSVVPRDVLHPFSMRVVGSERIAVPAGTFDCWKMAVTYDGHTRSLWVRKSDQIGVMSRDETKGSAGIREVVLVSETHSRGFGQ